MVRRDKSLIKGCISRPADLGFTCEAATLTKVLLTTSVGWQAKEGAALDDAVSAAEKLQLARDSKQATVLSQEIETAPAVQLTSGDGDVSTTGARPLAVHVMGYHYQCACVGKECDGSRALGGGMCRACTSCSDISNMLPFKPGLALSFLKLSGLDPRSP